MKRISLFLLILCMPQLALTAALTTDTQGTLSGVPIRFEAMAYAPTSVTATSAVLNGSSTANGYPSFILKKIGGITSTQQYFLSESLSAPAISAGNFKYAVTGLQCGSEYTYHVQVSHELSYMGVTESNSVMFTTASCPVGITPVACTKELRLCSDGSTMPRDTATCQWQENKCPTPQKISVTTKSPTSVTSTSAVLNASMTTKGYPSFFVKEASSSSTPVMYSLFDNLSSPANSAGDFKYILTGLKCGTSYTYYAQASHEFSYMGSAQGGSVSFTTVKCETIQPVACTKEYAPVCGQPPMPTCSTGMVCAQAMPSPKTYGNTCTMSSEKATLLYSGACKTIQPVVPTPSVQSIYLTTRFATSITGNTAILNGEFGIPGSYSNGEFYHRFILAKKYDSTNPPVALSLPKTNKSGQFSYKVEGLQCNTEYTYYIESLYSYNNEDYIVRSTIKSTPVTLQSANCTTSVTASPISCTKELRRCPDGSVMPRDEKTCEWKQNMCPTITGLTQTGYTTDLYSFAKKWNLTSANSSKYFNPTTQLTRRESAIILRQSAKIFNSGSTISQLYTREFSRYFASNTKMTRYEARKILEYILMKSGHTTLVGAIDESNPKDIVTRGTLITWIRDVYIKINK